MYSNVHQSEVYRKCPTFEIPKSSATFNIAGYNFSVKLRSPQQKHCIAGVLGRCQNTRNIFLPWPKLLIVWVLTPLGLAQTTFKPGTAPNSVGCDGGKDGGPQSTHAGGFTLRIGFSAEFWGTLTSRVRSILTGLFWHMEAFFGGQRTTSGSACRAIRCKNAGEKIGIVAYLG